MPRSNKPMSSARSTFRDSDLGSSLGESKRNFRQTGLGNTIIAHFDLSDQTNQVDSRVPIDEPLFQPTPSEVYFPQYEPFKTYKFTISLRNKDKVARRVKLVPPKHHHFSLSAPARDQSDKSKVAPGMEQRYSLLFKPTSREDYECDLVCVTEREKFIIPIRARGDRASVDLDANILFENIPVNYDSKRPVMLRNNGPKATSFTVDVADGFKVEPAHGFLDQGQSTQISLTCNPAMEGDFESLMTVILDDDVAVSSNVLVSAINANVHLEMKELEVPQTYINLVSQKPITLINRSDVPIKFHWKNAATKKEEDDRNAEIHQKLMEDGAEEYSYEMHQMANQRELEKGDDFIVSSDEEEDQEFYSLRAEQRLQATYKKRVQDAMQENQADFDTEAFSIYPLQGEIYPGGMIECSVVFRPSDAIDYHTTAYCEVTGRDERLALEIMGQGIGPRAAFSYDMLDIGEVFINAVHHYEVTLQNLGDIEAKFSLIEEKREKYSRLTFTPSSGVLGVGRQGNDDQVKIRVDFTSALIGEFQETVYWALHGNVEPLRLTFKGTVIGPTFEFDRERITFGQISYGFLNSEVVTLNNTSEIPLHYNLRIPQDGKFMKREFGLEPNSGIILPQQGKQIQIDFVSETVKQYEGYELVIDVNGVGEALQALPIKASCHVPEVHVNVDELHYGDCYMLHPYVLTIPLTNHSDLYAKFEVQMQDDISRNIAILEPASQGSSVAPNSTYDMPIRLTAQKLGAVTVPLYISIPGSESLPQLVTVHFNGKGPQVSASASSLNWGVVPVLQKMTKEVTLHNNAPIPAEVKAFFQKAASFWDVDHIHMEIPANGSFKLQVSCILRDNQSVLHDTLHLLIKDGVDVKLSLRAQGVGSTLGWEETGEPLQYPHKTIMPPPAESKDLDDSNVSEETLMKQGNQVQYKELDFGHVFSHSETVRTFRLHNQSRKPQSLVWDYIDPNDETQTMTTKKGGMKFKPKKRDMSTLESIFKIEPYKLVLEAGHAMEFTVTGKSASDGHLLENWVLFSTSGQAKKADAVFSVTFHANFVSPRLDFSRQKLEFQCMNDPRHPMDAQTQSLTLRNTCPLPLVFWTRVNNVSFRIDRLEYELAPGEAATTSLQFLTEAEGDRTSADIKTNLNFSYRDHPRTDRLQLVGSVCFPNLTFEQPKIDFGCILNNTSRRVVKTMTNNSQIACQYRWVFSTQEEKRSSMSKLDREKRDHALSLYKPSEIFDITPISGTLMPGESEDVEYVFYGHKELKYDILAVCEVVGGPKYGISLTGRADKMSYKLDKTSLNFGARELGIIEERFITLQNTSKVDFQFLVQTDKIKHQVIDVKPIRGTLPAGEKLKISIVFSSLLPQPISEMIELCVAYFDPIPLTITALGVYPSVAICLPRIYPDGYDKHLATAQESLRKLDEEKNAESVETVDISESNLSTARSTTSLDPLVDFDKKKSDWMPVEFTDSQLKEFPLLRDEKEADRLHFMEHAMVELAKRNEEKKRKALLNKTSSAPKPVKAVKHSESNADLPKVNVAHRMRQAVPFTIGEVLCDFGNIVLGTRKKRSFKVINTSGAPVSFEFVKRALMSSVFTVSPFSVSRLPPGESVEFTVTCTTTVKRNTPKLEELVLPVNIRNGPMQDLRLRANVTVPDLDLSRTKVNFGSIFVGETREVIVQLRNDHLISAEWELRPFQGAFKDREHFSVSPTKGTLHPGGRTNVKFTFTPTRVGDRFSIKVPLKILQNTKKKMLTLSGSSKDVSLNFSSTLLNLGPVLPYQDSEPVTLSMTNTSDRDIEIYSLDFDTVHQWEEDVLRGEEGYDDDNLLRTAPRLPGQNLPASIMSNYRKREMKRKKDDELSESKNLNAAEIPVVEVSQANASAQNSARAPSAKSTARDGKLSHRSDQLSPSKDPSPLPNADPNESMNESIDEVGILTDVADVVAPSRPASAGAVNDSKQGDEVVRNIVVIGGPYSGRTTVSNSLASTYNLENNIVSLDKIVGYFYDLAVANEEKLREEEAVRKQNEKRSSSKPPAHVPVKDDSADKKDNPMLDLGNEVRSTMIKYREETEAAEEKLVAAALADATKSDGKSKSRSSAMVKKPPATKKKKGKKDENLFTESKGALPQSLLRRLVSAYLLQNDGSRFQEGVIFDGLDNLFCEQYEAAAVIRDVYKDPDFSLYHDNNLHVIVLNCSKSVAISRMVKKEKACKKVIAEVVPPLIKRLFPKLATYSPARDREKLPEDKREKMDEAYDLYINRKTAEETLDKITHVDKARIEEFYPDEAVLAAQAAAAAALAMEATVQVTDVTLEDPAVEEDTPVVEEEGLETKETPAEPVIEDVFTKVLTEFDVDYSPPRTSFDHLRDEIHIEEPAADEPADEKKKDDKSVPVKRGRGKLARQEEEAKKAEADAAAAAAAEAEAAAAAAVEAAVELTPEQVAEKYGTMELPLGEFNWVKAMCFGPYLIEDLTKSVTNWTNEIFFEEIDEAALDPNWVPPSRTFQLVQRPAIRKERRPIQSVQFVEAVQVEKVQVVEEKVEEVTKGKKKTGHAAKKEQVVEEELPPKDIEYETKYNPIEKYRWIIPAGQTVDVMLMFSSPSTGTFGSELGFEIVGALHHSYTVSVRGYCATPTLSEDPRSVFMRRLKQRKPGVSVRQQYILSENVFDFGPLLLGKHPDDRLPFSVPDPSSSEGGVFVITGDTKKQELPHGFLESLPEDERSNLKLKMVAQRGLKKSNGAVFRITNVGLFPCHVDFGLENGITSAILSGDSLTDDKKDKSSSGRGRPLSRGRAAKVTDSSRNTSKKQPTKPKGKKGEEKKANPISARKKFPPARVLGAELDALKDRPVFQVYPSFLDLEVDESQDIVIWSFPQNRGTFQDALIASVRDNAVPIVFPLRCTGTAPEVEVSQTTIAFDRLLSGMSAIRKITLRNLSTVPCKWLLDDESLAPLSPDIIVSPTSGQIEPGRDVEITMTFLAESEKEIDQSLSLLVFDCDGILGVVDEVFLTVTAESFMLDCKVLGLPTSGLDFKTIRVVDEVVKDFSIVNQGKYDAIFKFSPYYPSDIYTVEPVEGLLKPGEETAVFVCFFCPSLNIPMIIIVKLFIVILIL